MSIPEAREMLARRWNCRPSDLNITSVTETITETVVEVPLPCVPRYPVAR